MSCRRVDRCSCDNQSPLPVLPCLPLRLWYRYLMAAGVCSRAWPRVNSDATLWIESLHFEVFSHVVPGPRGRLTEAHPCSVLTADSRPCRSDCAIKCCATSVRNLVPAHESPGINPLVYHHNRSAGSAPPPPGPCAMRSPSRLMDIVWHEMTALSSCRNWAWAGGPCGASRHRNGMGKAVHADRRLAASVGIPRREAVPGLGFCGADSADQFRWLSGTRVTSP